MVRAIVPAAIVFAGEYRDVKIALVVVFVLAMAAGLWATSRMRKRIGQSGLPDWHPGAIMAAFKANDVLTFVCCWIVGAGALLILKNLQ